MKKFYSFTLVFCVLFLLVGCSNKDSNASNDVKPDETTLSSDKNDSVEYSNTSESEESDENEYANYRPIQNVFDLNTIMTLNDDEIYDKGGEIILDHFRVLDLGLDNMREYHLLLQSPDGGPLFLVVTKVTDHNPISGEADTIYGSLYGRGSVNENQINSGFTTKYEGQTVIVVNSHKIEESK